MIKLVRADGLSIDTVDAVTYFQLHAPLELVYDSFLIQSKESILLRCKDKIAIYIILLKKL